MLIIIFFIYLTQNTIYILSSTISNVILITQTRFIPHQFLRLDKRRCRSVVGRDKEGLTRKS